MPTLAEQLYDKIANIQAIDIHSHVRQMQPSAASLRELLSYHYYTELAFSSGLPKQRMAADLSDDEAIPALVEAMANFDNTVQYGWIIELARKLFDFPDRRLTLENWRPLAQAAADRLGSDGWMAEVLRRGSIEKVFLTNSFDEDLDGFDRQTLVPCLRCDDLVFKLPQITDRLADATGVTVTDMASLRKAVAAIFQNFVDHQAGSAAISLPPEFVCWTITDEEADPIIQKAVRGEGLDEDEEDALGAYVMSLLAENCRESGLAFQLMIGAIRDIYAHGVHQGTDIGCNKDTLAQYAELFNRFPEVTFTVSHLSPTLAHELLSYTWIFQNVRASGHWWYTNIPGLIEPELRSRIEALPKTKLLGYYSDAYYLEFTLPKFNMYRWSLAHVLAHQVETRRLTEDEALDVARHLLRDNAIEIFGL